MKTDSMHKAECTDSAASCTFYFLNQDNGAALLTMRVIKGLHFLNRRLLAGIYEADVALAANRHQRVCHGQTHHLLAVLQPHLHIPSTHDQ